MSGRPVWPRQRQEKEPETVTARCPDSSGFAQQGSLFADDSPAATDIDQPSGDRGPGRRQPPDASADRPDREGRKGDIVPPPLDDPDLLDRLRLIRTENVGPVTFHQLLARFGNAAAALEALPELARRGGRKKPLVAAGLDRIHAEIERLQAIGACLIPAGHPAYPRALGFLPDAPPVLSALGRTELLQRPAVAMVGARNASLNGKRLAEIIARGLGVEGYVVVSGLARGIDAAAHGGSLETGTVAAVGGGVDIVFPPENQTLYERMCHEGCIVGEMPVGEQPKARHFPRRNRVISGISLGVLVVEAALRSGSLITARYAADQGRDVFAVPGSPLDQRCRGTNNLLRQGAILTENAADVIELLRRQTPERISEGNSESYAHAPGEVPSAAELDKYRGILLEALGPSPVPVDEIVRECHLSPSVVLTLLIELELAGRLERHPGNSVSILPEM